MSATDEEVSHFMAVTGSADPDQAATYLEMSGGDLETAVGLFMEHNHGGGGGLGGLGGTANDADMAAAMAPQDIRAPDATRTMRLMDDVDVGHHHHPALAMMNAMMDEQLAQSAFASAPSGLNARDVVNAAAVNESKRVDSEDDEAGIGDGEDDDDDDYIEVIGSSAPPGPARLSDMFAPPDHLMHKAGGFQGARQTAKDSKRWLLVNLQRDSEFACHAMNRDVWRDELVENLVREGFIFWQAVRVMGMWFMGQKQKDLGCLQLSTLTVFCLLSSCKLASSDGYQYRRENLF
jgi:UBX domain-containing protein 7